jgi:hypothetical protein
MHSVHVASCCSRVAHICCTVGLCWYWKTSKRQLPTEECSQDHRTVSQRQRQRQGGMCCCRPRAAADQVLPHVPDQVLLPTKHRLTFIVLAEPARPLCEVAMDVAECLQARSERPVRNCSKGQAQPTAGQQQQLAKSMC